MEVKETGDRVLFKMLKRRIQCSGIEIHIIQEPQTGHW
jgi:hypothetical protein